MRPNEVCLMKEALTPKLMRSDAGSKDYRSSDPYGYSLVLD